MSQITPSELSEREFTRSIRGYNPVEVDEYINKIVENYAALYRENIELTKKLDETEKKLASATAEEDNIKKTLETARKAGDAVMEEAYTKADTIISSVKTGCDAILLRFRDKIEAQKKALDDIQESVHTFKNELFEKYRLHIELIEQMTPVYEYQKERSPEDYVSEVVADMKKEVAAQYGLSLESVSASNQNGAEAPTVEMTTTRNEFLAVSEAAKEIAQGAERPQKRKDTIPSISSLLDDNEGA